MRNDTNPHTSSENPGSNRPTAKISPHLHDLIAHLPSLSKPNYAEVVKEIIKGHLSKQLDELIMPLPLSTVVDTKNIPDDTRHAARLISSILGEIINDLLCSKESIVLDQHGKFLLDWAVQNFEFLRNIECQRTEAEENILEKAISSGQWEEVFEQEVEKMAVANLLAHAALIIKGSGVCYTVLRQDLAQAVEGTAQGTGALFDEFGGWHFLNALVPTDGMDAGIEKLASFKDLKRSGPARYTFEEFSDYLIDEGEKAAFQGCTISYFPLIFGTQYLGGMYIVNNKEGSEFTNAQMKDLKLATFAGAQALARVMRIQNATRSSFETGEDHSDD